VDSSQKALTQFRLRLTGVLYVFRLYGMDVFIPGCVSAIEQLAMELHERLKATEKEVEDEEGD